MSPHHVFVLCDRGGPEAEELRQLGLREGPPNSHPGQGTRCRRFFFENLYLELLWVEDEDEARTETTRVTGLWERWSKRKVGACPFGVACSLSTNGESPPFSVIDYRPHYLPSKSPLLLASDPHVNLPLVFLLPPNLTGEGSTATQSASPPELARGVDQPEGLRRVQTVHLEGPSASLSPAIRSALERTGRLSFTLADEWILHLRFESHGEGRTRENRQEDLRPSLPLVLTFASG